MLRKIATAFALSGLLVYGSSLRADTLHGFCWGSSTCSDQGSNTPTSNNPPQFGFEGSGSGNTSGSLFLEFLVPTSLDPNPSSFGDQREQHCDEYYDHSWPVQHHGVVVGTTGCLSRDLRDAHQLDWGIHRRTVLRVSGRAGHADGRRNSAGPNAGERSSAGQLHSGIPEYGHHRESELQWNNQQRGDPGQRNAVYSSGS